MMSRLIKRRRIVDHRDIMFIIISLGLFLGAAGKKLIIGRFQETKDFLMDEEVVNINQAVTKDSTSSSKFSGSCVLTLQTLPRMKRSVG